MAQQVKLSGVLIKAIIFDFDGVLYDSPREAIKRIIKIVRKSGYFIHPKIWENIHKRVWDEWGSSGKKIIRNAFGIENDKICEKLHQKWIQMDLECLYPLVEYVDEVLKYIYSHGGFITGIVTSRGGKTLYPIIEKLFSKYRFDFIQSKDDYLYQKPDPRVFTPLIDYLAKREIMPGETLYVGDGPLDFLASSGSGLIPINVSTGLHEKKHFLELGQKEENIISSLRELIPWIERFENGVFSAKPHNTHIKCDCGDKKMW